MYGYIYKITNKINGKCYVGLTTRTIEIRFREHIEEGVNLSPDDNSLLHKAIHKYGGSSFEIELLDTADSKEELSKKELYWAQVLNSMLPNGYNLAEPGHGGNLGETVNEKISDSLTGKNRWTAGRKRYNNGIKEILLPPNELPPEGFIRGRLPRTLEQVEKWRETMRQKSDEEREIIVQKQCVSRAKTVKQRTQEEQTVINNRISAGKMGVEPWNKGKQDWWSEEHKQHVVESASKPKTSAHRANLSKSCTESECHSGTKNGMYGKHPVAHNKGKIYITNGNIIKYILESELDIYIAQGFRRGKK